MSMNAYEAERAANVAANKARMSALGLGSRPIGAVGGGGAPSGGGGAGLEDGGERAPKLRRSKASGVAGAAPATAPTRSSRRARGHDAEEYTSATDWDRAGAGGGTGDGDGAGDGAGAGGTKKNGTLRKEFPAGADTRSLQSST
jgi:hypothetical protein